ncbi:MAG: redoxin domain-containing protein [Phycisphaerales bacterium]|nr:redoxin domain-containing protein [Phycisphaerales bacterium]
MLHVLLAAIISQAPAATQAAPAAPAAPTTLALSIGSKAPIPEISDFVRGEKPTFFEPGKVYVIEFWATWCPPCRQSMPHLTKLAEDMKSKGVVIVGVSDEKVETVRTFLEKDEWKQKARYTLATDPDRSTHKAYMEASGQGGIPTAFIVKEGVVQWIGHPMEMDAPLAKIVDGTWDPKTAKQSFEDSVAEEMKAMGRQNDMTKAIDSKDWDKAVALIDAEIAASTGEEAMQSKVQKAQILLVAGRSEAAYALCAELVKEDPALRNFVATSVLHLPDVADRRVDLAITWLTDVTSAAGPVNPQVLAELAYAWSLKGDFTKAADFMRRAIDTAKSLGPTAADYVADLTAQLKGYESKAAGNSSSNAAGSNSNAADSKSNK